MRKVRLHTDPTTPQKARTVMSARPFGSVTSGRISAQPGAVCKLDILTNIFFFLLQQTKPLTR